MGFLGVQGRIFCRKCSVPACGRAHCVKRLGRPALAMSSMQIRGGSPCLGRCVQGVQRTHRYARQGPLHAQHQAARDAQAGEQGRFAAQGHRRLDPLLQRKTFLPDLDKPESMTYTSDEAVLQDDVNHRKPTPKNLSSFYGPLLNAHLYPRKYENQHSNT